MKQILLLIACATIFAGCEPSSIRKGRKAYKEYFNETLKDPESLRIYSEKIVSNDEHGVKFEVDMGSKNSYGAYTRSTYYFRTIGSLIFESRDYKIPEKTTTKKETTTSYTSPPSVTPYNVSPAIEYKLSEYKQYMSNSTAMTEFSVGETLTLKSPILAAKNATKYTLLRYRIRDNNEEVFSSSFSIGDYKLLPKGTKVIVKQVFNKQTTSLVAPRIEFEECIQVEVTNGKFKGEKWFISNYIQK